MAGTRPLTTDPLRNFKFLVYIPHPIAGGVYDPYRLGFSSVSGISAQTQPITYREGGDNTTTRKMPGQTDFPPLMFRRGLLPTNAVTEMAWMREIFFVKAGGGLNDGTKDFRTDILVDVLDHPVTSGQVTLLTLGAINPSVRVSFKFYNCWISQLSYSDLEAGGNGILVTQMEIMHEGFDIKSSSGAPGNYLSNDPYNG